MLPAGQKNKFRRSDVALAGNNIASSSAAATSDDQAASSAAGTSIRPRSPTLNARPRSSSARASAGPADGQSSDAGGGKSSKLKKPRKKGWKGYSMQYIDTDGNIIEERPRDETPPEEPTAEEKALALAAAAADYGDVEMGTGSSSVPNGSRGELRWNSRMFFWHHADDRPFQPTLISYIIISGSLNILLVIRSLSSAISTLRPCWKQIDRHASEPATFGQDRNHGTDTSS